MVLSTRALRAGACTALFVFVAACGGGDAPVAPLRADKPRTGPVPPSSPASLEGLQPSRGSSGRQAQASTNGGYVIDTTDRAQVLLFYRTVYASSTPVAIGWTGNLATCNAGDTSVDFRAAELRRINWFRAMAGVPASVQLDAAFNQKAQQAAMLMAANNSLSHAPPTNWTCYNAVAAEAASKSNLALGRHGADSISDGYMRDEGSNNTAAGHRRWVLYPQTQFMGAGDVDGGVRANALWVMDANIFGPRPGVRSDFVAWPPRGYTPYQVVYPRWSFAYPHADFSAATVTMTENGVPIATRKEVLVDNIGENALVWFPGAYADGMNWAKPSADTVYEVTVSNVVVNGVTRNFTYAATVFDPDTTASAPLPISGSSTLAAGQSGAYSFGAVPGATSYEWRSLATTPYSLADGAESGAGNFTVSTSPGYSVVATDVSASGASSFHFAHPVAADQSMTLNRSLAATASSTVRFASRLGLSSPFQRAMVEVSIDDGANWTAVFEQAGQQSGTTTSFGETTFSTRTISLAAFANRTILLRWRYALGQGSRYPQTSAGIGWYVDDIQVGGFSAVSANPSSGIVSNSFETAAATDSFVLQARAGMYGYFSDWGLLKPVSVTARATGPDCLFNWAEVNYPSLFSPPTDSQTAGPYYFRHYAGTGFYLGVSSQDSQVYYLNGGLVPTDAGTRGFWLDKASCAP